MKKIKFIDTLYTRIKENKITSAQIIAVFNLVNSGNGANKINVDIDRVCNDIKNDKLSQEEFVKLLKKHNIDF